MVSASADAIQATTPMMRRMLLVASLLVLAVGVQLFILTEQTDRFFAWTIASPLTAAFLGAAYWSSFAIEFAASRQRTWARARIAVPSVMLFTGLTLVVTLIHVDRFHFADPDPLTRFAAWVWVGVYAVVPPVLAVLLVGQLRAPGADMPRIAPLPAWVLVVLGTHAALLTILGVALLIAPAAAMPLWPWALTPLTARAIGAWAFALGIAAAHAIAENDWPRIHVATVSYTAFGILEVIALARYPGEFAWGSPQGWIFLIFLASVLVIGIYGWRVSSRYAAQGEASAST